jgi:hypothetical protein
VGADGGEVGAGGDGVQGWVRRWWLALLQCLWATAADIPSGLESARDAFSTPCGIADGYFSNWGCPLVKLGL